MSEEAVNQEAAEVEAAEAVAEVAQEQVTPSEPQQVQPEAQAPSTKKRFKLKVDGEEIEEEIDLANEQELIKQLQLAKVANKRMQSEAMTKKQAQALIQAIKQNPEEALSKLGINPRDFQESYLAKQLEEALLTPEQKQVREAQRIIEEHKRLIEEQQKAKEAQEMQELEARFAEEYQRTIIEALEVSGLPKTRRSMARIAQAMKLNLSRGTSFDPKVLAKMAREDYEAEVRELVSSFQDEDSLLQFLGDVADRIRKQDLKRLKAKEPKQFTPPAPSQAPKARDEEDGGIQSRKLTKAEWQKILDEKVK